MPTPAGSSACASRFRAPPKMRNSAALAVPRRWISLGRLRLFAVGALAGLGQAPFDLPVLALPAFAAAIVLGLGDGCLPREAARRGWWAGFGYFLLTLHWIVDPFFVDPARDGWMAPFALVFMAGGMALFWALAGLVVLHAAAALHHHLFLGDATLARMLPRGWLRAGAAPETENRDA